MALNVGTLTAWVDEQKLGLIGKAVLAAKTARLLNMQTGVKGKAAINLLTNSTTFGDGSSCGWDEAGTSTLTQRVIETGIIKVNKSFCDKTLANLWAGYQVKIAAGSKTLPFEQAFAEAEIASVAEALEKAIWQGDTDSLTANLNKFDGILKHLATDTASVVHAVNTGFTTISESNVIDIIDSVFRAIPEAIIARPTVKIFCGADTFRKYILALRAKNWFHYSQDMDANMELVVPGTTITLVAVNGLNGTDRIVAFDTEEVMIGTDLEGDEEKFELWYSQDNREFRLAIEFNYGVNYAFPDHVVEFTKATQG